MHLDTSKGEMKKGDMAACHTNEVHKAMGM